MTWDHDRAEQKTAELLLDLTAKIRSCGPSEDDAGKIAKILLHNAVRVSPPEKQEFNMELITLAPSGRRGGRSLKAGNISLNMRSFADAVANGAFAAVSTYQVPWLAPFAFLLVWNALWRSAQVELSETDAALIWTMWVYRDRSNNEIADVGLLDKLNGHLSKYSRPAVSQEEIANSLRHLEAIQSIKRSSRNPTNWWLCEWVRTAYR